MLLACYDGVLCFGLIHRVLSVSSELQCVMDCDHLQMQHVCMQQSLCKGCDYCHYSHVMHRLRVP